MRATYDQMSEIIENEGEIKYRQKNEIYRPHGTLIRETV